jgi:hypothetical protein
VAKQGYLAPNDHGGAGGQVAFSYCRSLYALALMFPPKLSSHPTEIAVELYRRRKGAGAGDVFTAQFAVEHGRWMLSIDGWVTLRARWVMLRARWVTLRARWVTLRARWVTLRARWVTLRARWVTLRARWVTLGDAESSLGDAESSLGDAG